MSKLWRQQRFSPTHIAIWGTAVLSFLIFLTTLQTDINGSNHPYVTDVGEIQNALPRWGTLHFTGYPQYSVIGSLFVTLLRLVGIAPALSSSLYSAVWGAITLALLVVLMIELDVHPVTAVTTSLLFGLATSMWVDASIAEVHTMTMALTCAALLAAIRFGHTGAQRQLYLLAFLSGQGVAHQRAFMFVGLGLFILVAHHWRVIWQQLTAVIALLLLGPLTYLYLPLRAWMGADWLFSSPGTWQGFWALILDTKVERIVEIPTSLALWNERMGSIWQLLVDDWPWPLLLLGLVGLLLSGRPWRERLGLTASWLPYYVISLIIWEGSVSDALLAVKLPVIALAAIGLAFMTEAVRRWQPNAERVAWGVWSLTAVFLFLTHRPPIVAITRDLSAMTVINRVAQTEPAADGRPITFMALWGNDYWQLAYAQTYQNQFPYLELVDHDTNFGRIVSENKHVWTLNQTFYQRPLSWWEDQMGAVHLTAVAPGITEIMPEPAIAPLASPLLLLDNGIAIQAAQVAWIDDATVMIDITWQAQTQPTADYSIAIHLVTQDPPIGPQDIIAQADSTHPVDGWYPTSQWTAGEVIHDAYAITVPSATAPIVARIGMYAVTANGEFLNSGWLSIPLNGEH